MSLIKSAPPGGGEQRFRCQHCFSHCFPRLPASASAQKPGLLASGPARRPAPHPPASLSSPASLESLPSREKLWLSGGRMEHTGPCGPQTSSERKGLRGSRRPEPAFCLCPGAFYPGRFLFSLFPPFRESQGPRLSPPPAPPTSWAGVPSLLDWHLLGRPLLRKKPESLWLPCLGFLIAGSGGRGSGIVCQTEKHETFLNPLETLREIMPGPPGTKQRLSPQTDGKHNSRGSPWGHWELRRDWRGPRPFGHLPFLPPSPLWALCVYGDAQRGSSQPI